MAASDKQEGDQERPRRNMGSRDQGERDGAARDENRSQFVRRERTVWRGRDENIKRDAAEQRPERPADRTDRPDRPERRDRIEPPARSDNRFDRPGRSDNRFDRPERSDNRFDRPGRSESFDRPERPERPERPQGGPSRDFSTERARDFSERPRTFNTERRESRSWADRDQRGGDRGDRVDRTGDSSRDRSERPARPEVRADSDPREMPRGERSGPFGDRGAPRRDFGTGGGFRGGRESSGGGYRGRDDGFRSDDFPRRERETSARDERRPARYSSAAGSRYGMGRGGPRAPRQPLKKKKKVRVFFHQALTRILLPKLLTKSKYLSPRLAKIFIETGRVRVNARVVSSPYYEVNLRKERVTIDEAPTEYPRRLAYMIYNKPHGVVCTKGDVAFDAVFEPESTWSFPFGRLSKAASGLVILSSDPRMVKRQHVVDIELQKEYRVKLNKNLTDEQLDEFRRGVMVGDEYLVPLRVNLVRRNANTMWLDVILLDDSYHRIYGAFKALGAEVLLLRRSRIALINDQMVPSGEWRELSGFEIAALGLAKFMPGELPPEPLPPPRPKMERKFPPRRGDGRSDGRGDSRGDSRDFRSDSRDFRSDSRDFRGDSRRGPGGPGGGRSGGGGGGWDRRPGGPPSGGPGGRRFSPPRPSREEEYEERLRQEAEADAIGNK